MLASTTSSASRCKSSFGPYNGDLGSAMSPVLVDSRIPKGAINFINESILLGLADLTQVLASRRVHVGVPIGTYTSTIQLLVLISRTLPPN